MSKNKTIDFLIFYEVKNREFESIVMLKNELCKRGYKVKYYSFYDLDNKRKIQTLRNRVKVAVMPSLYHDQEILNITYSVAGITDKIVNLRWEQVYRNRVETEFDSYMYPKETAMKAYHCCWGSRPLELYKQAGICDNRLKIVGPMQMDLLLPQYQRYYLSREQLFDEYDIPKNKPVILFISSFTIGTFDDADADNYLMQFNEVERACLKRFYKCEKKSRIKICEWLTRLASEKDCTIIYRPHPVEESTKEIKELQAVPNIRIISELNIKQWILSCDQVYSWYSTSFAEAYEAKVPCYVLRPEIIEIGEDLPIYSGLSFIDEYSEFSSTFDACMLKEKTDIVNYPVIDTYYSIDPEYPSYRRVADYLEDILRNGDIFCWNDIDTLKRIKSRLNNKKRFFKNSLYGCNSKIIRRIFGNRIAEYEKQMESNRTKIITDEQFIQMEAIMKSLTDDN